MPSPLTAKKLREKRKRIFQRAKKQYGDYEKIPGRLRERLEREPIARNRTDGKKEPLSTRDLSLITLFRKTKKVDRYGRAYSGSVRPIGEILAREVLPELNFNQKDQASILQFLRGKDSDYFWRIVNIWVELPVNKYDTIYSLALTGLHIALFETGASPERNTEKLKKARQFLDEMKLRMRQLEASPEFIRRESKRTIIRAEPGFRPFFDQLKKRGIDITAFIEGQPDISRPLEHEFAGAKQIEQLQFVKYDKSKVKEWTLTNQHGQKIKVVSKRLSPMKSIFAEQEFETSKILFQLGIKTPRPIGIIEDKGNTYFLWERLNTVKNILERFSRAIKDQEYKIVRNLRKLGVKNYDLVSRNFVVTMGHGRPIVWLVDLERIELPEQLRRRKSA